MSVRVTRPPIEGWAESFFDADYLRLWEAMLPAEQTEREADGIWKMLGLWEGCRVLDAPCGWGRLSLALARKGAVVLGVDRAGVLIDRAEHDRSAHDQPGGSEARLRYAKRDIRIPLPGGGFDAAVNVFTSLGYGGEEDDLAILTTLREAVRAKGLVLVETAHRDAVVARVARGARPSWRLPDGTLVVEEPTFDAIAGRVDTAWHWSGPAGAGRKSASLRVYTATELVRLIERAGLRVLSAHRGCSPDAFSADSPDLGGRLALVAERP